MAGHIHLGDAVTNGPVIVSFNPTFNTAGTTSTASGTVSIRSTLADSLQNLPIYVNFHSTNFPGGLVRAQLDKVIDFAADVSMTGASEVSPVVTTATGKAFIRITTDKTLYSKVTISNLEAGDAMTAAHIHKAGPTTNGPVIQILCANAGEFGISMNRIISDALITSIKTDSIYANAHSTAHPGGIIRAQIR